MRDLMGGFFGLELPEPDVFPYAESSCCAYVNSGRAALELLLRSLPQLPQRVWVPRFACDTLLQPMRRLGLPIARYRISEALEPLLPDDLAVEDCLILINYFGVCEEPVARAVAAAPCPVLADATTALYAPPPPGTAGCFYSPRKFSGLSDGGVALAPHPLALPEKTDLSAPRALCLMQRLESGADAALPASEEAEAALNAPAKRMSPLSRRLLRSIDWRAAAQRRLRNYDTLHSALAELNRLPLPTVPAHAPMCYPLVSGIPDLRDALIDAGIALPLYWPEVIETTSADAPENCLARTLLPLPLDQRYGEEEMLRLIRLIRGE